LEEVTIPSSVKDVGLSAFSECPNLTKVTIQEGLTNIGTFVFSKNPKLSIITLPNSITSIDPSAFLECENLNFVCSTNSFAYKFATIKNIPLYSEKKNNFNTPDAAGIKDLFKLNKGAETKPEPKPEPIVPQEVEIPVSEEPTDTTTESDLNENLLDFLPTEGDSQEIDNILNSPLQENIPAINTQTFAPYALLNGLSLKEVDFMNDVSNLFNNIIDPNKIEGLNVPSDSYYTDERLNINPQFDPRYTFNGNPFDPLGEPPLYDLNSPNSALGIQEEYSSPNKINNIVVKQNSTSSVILSWDEYPETNEYHLLHFNIKTKAYDDVCKLKTNKALLTGIVPSHIQQYKVIAYKITKGTKELIASSNAVSVSTILPPVSGLEVIAATSNSLTFSWAPIPDAVNYIVYAYNSMQKCFVPIDETSNNCISFSNLDGISHLKIKVAGVSMINNVECLSKMSDEIVGYTTIATVKDIVISSYTSNSIKLAWPSIPNIDIYKIYAYNDKTSRFEYIETTPINQIVFNHLLPNKEYKFKIRAASYIDDVEVVGAPSDIISAHTTA